VSLKESATNLLRRMRIWRVALVDRPANPDARVVFYKSDGKTKRVAGKDLTASDFAHVGNPDDPSTWKLPVHDAAHVRNALARFNQTEGMSSEEKAKAKAKILARAKTHGVEVSKDGPEKSPSGEGVDQTPEPGEQADADEGKYGDEDDTTMTTQQRKGAGEPDKVQGESPQDTEMCKRCGGPHATEDHDQYMKDGGPGLSDVHVPAGDIHKGEHMETQADRDQLISLKKALEVEKTDKEALKARLEKMEGERRHERFIAKVKRFSYVPTLLPDDFATIFAKIDAALSEPEREKFDKMMTATNAALRQSALFQEYGVTGHKGIGSEPENQITALTKAEQAKDPKLTKGQAYEKVLRENPELYHEYLLQQKEAGR
jgi:hypothetical protein